MDKLQHNSSRKIEIGDALSTAQTEAQPWYYTVWGPSKLQKPPEDDHLCVLFRAKRWEHRHINTKADQKVLVFNIPTQTVQDTAGYLIDNSPDP